MRVFKTIHGEKINLIQHIADVIQKYPSVTIHVGADSQSRKTITSYAIAVAFRYDKRGVHYVYTKFKVPKIRDRRERLLKEVYESVEVANWITSQMDIIVNVQFGDNDIEEEELERQLNLALTKEVNIEIDIDFNPNAKYFSYDLISEARGIAEWKGYKVNIKPYNQTAEFENFACKIADKHARE